MRFGPCVSAHNEDIFVYLKIIHSTFICWTAASHTFSIFSVREKMEWSLTVLYCTQLANVLAGFLWKWKTTTTTTTPSLCKRIIFESAPASERRKPYVLVEGSVFWISAPSWAPFCSAQKVYLYVESSLRCSLTKTVWVLSTFGWFGPSIGRVPSVYVRQRMCIPKTLVSIVHLPNEGVGLDSFVFP